MDARLGGKRQARAPPGTGTGTPSSGYTHRSLAPVPVRHASVDTATQRPTALQDDTLRDREETARIAANPQLAGRFRRWWQVMGSNHRRLSRRSYRTLLPALLHSCRPAQMPASGWAGATLSAICTCAGFRAANSADSHVQARAAPRPAGRGCRSGQAASVPGSVKASRWSPKSAMISRRPPRAST
jgi:hypothetical protein